MRQITSIDKFVKHLRQLHHFWSLKIEYTNTESIVTIEYLTEKSGVFPCIGRDTSTLKAANEAWQKFVKRFPEYE